MIRKEKEAKAFCLFVFSSFSLPPSVRKKLKPILAFPV